MNILATSSIPDTGVDLTTIISDGVTALGLIVLAAVGGYAAFLIIRKGLRWVGRAFG